MKKYIHSRKIQAILLIVLAILLEFVSAFCLKDAVDKYLVRLYYTSQIVSGIFVVSGVVIAVWQYYLSSKSTKNNLEMIQVQRAIDLSEYFKDNILRYYPAINYIFKKTKILSILETVKLDQLKDFDVHELETLYSKQQIEELQAIQYSNDFLMAVLEANDIYGLNLNIVATETVGFNGHGKEITLKVNKNSIAVAFMSNLINATLNNMEYFALHFQHNTADESVVYHSLHKAYLEIVMYLYYYIAKLNNDSTDKLYTNVIWLFKEWRSTQKNRQFERTKKLESLQTHGTIIEN